VFADIAAQVWVLERGSDFFIGERGGSSASWSDLRAARELALNVFKEIAIHIEPAERLYISLRGPYPT
jgi:hypothetical protein